MTFTATSTARSLAAEIAKSAIFRWDKRGLGTHLVTPVSTARERDRGNFIYRRAHTTFPRWEGLGTFVGQWGGACRPRRAAGGIMLVKGIFTTLRDSPYPAPTSTDGAECGWGLGAGVELTTGGVEGVPQSETIPADLLKKGGGGLRPTVCLPRICLGDRKGSGASIPRDAAAQHRKLGR